MNSLTILGKCFGNFDLELLYGCAHMLGIPIVANGHLRNDFACLEEEIALAIDSLDKPARNRILRQLRRLSPKK